MRRRPRASRVIAWVGASALALSLGILPSRADTAKRIAYGAKVTQYLTLQFDSKMCDGSEAYKLHTVSRRWHRQTMRRRVAQRTTVESKGRTCNDDYENGSYDTGWSEVCFGCDGFTKRWTPDYQSSFGWRFVVEDCCAEGHLIGAKVVGQIANRRGDPLKTLCTRAYISGNTSCNFAQGP
jgi:hypothetical protein